MTRFCIHELAHRVDTAAAQRWRMVLDRHRVRLDRLHARQPQAACAAYLGLLLRPVAWRLAAEGLELYPGLPGGDPDDPVSVGDARQHDHWSVAAVCTALGTAVGTLVTVAAFEPSRFDLRRKPVIFGLDCVGIENVQRELHRLRDGSSALHVDTQAAN